MRSGQSNGTHKHRISDERLRDVIHHPHIIHPIRQLVELLLRNLNARSSSRRSLRVPVDERIEIKPESKRDVEGGKDEHETSDDDQGVFVRLGARFAPYEDAEADGE